jgi:hypothetical protein
MGVVGLVIRQPRPPLGAEPPFWELPREPYVSFSLLNQVVAGIFRHN